MIIGFLGVLGRLTQSKELPSMQLKDLLSILWSLSTGPPPPPPPPSKKRSKKGGH